MNFVAFQIAVTSNPVPQTKAMAKTLKLQFFVTHGVTKKTEQFICSSFFLTSHDAHRRLFTSLIG